MRSELGKLTLSRSLTIASASNKKFPRGLKCLRAKFDYWIDLAMDLSNLRTTGLSTTPSPISSAMSTCFPRNFSSIVRLTTYFRMGGRSPSANSFATVAACAVISIPESNVSALCRDFGNAIDEIVPGLL